MAVDIVAQRAWETLLEEGIAGFPIKPSQIARKRGYHVFTYDQYIQATGRSLIELARRYGTDGFTLQIHGEYAVFYNPTSSIPRIRWTLAHELGHILLGHAALCRFAEAGEGKSREDREADRFAADLLCPMPPLYRCGLKSPEELARLCDLSLQAAGIQWQRLQREPPDTPLARTLAQTFAPFLQEYQALPPVATPLPALAFGRI